MAAEDLLPAFVQTKFGQSQTGSFCSYQLTHTEANFSATIDIASIPRLNNPPPTELTYARFPLSAMDTFVIPDNLNDAEKAFLQTLEVDENSINSIESTTREQSNSERWKNERKYRFTASRFQLISKRQRNHDKFAAELISPKPFSSRYVEHGLKYEPVALREYEKIMLTRNTPVKVLKCGLVISLHLPILAGSPDARVVDFGCEHHFGLAEVKCPETKYHVTPLEACEDPTFCCEAVNGQCRLKRDHAYFAQVQGQMGVTGASWCDFIVYTKKGISVERIAFDPAYWAELRQKLASYYFAHFIKHASKAV